MHRRHQPSSVALTRILQFVFVAIAVAAVPSAGAGAGAFSGGLEFGTDGLSQWQRVQAEPDRPLSDSFQRVTSPVRQGRYAAKIMVRHGYSQFGHNEDTELSWQSFERPGDDYYYAWSTLFPNDWESPYKWGIFAQWHATLGTSPAVSFGARGDTAHVSLLAGRTDERLNTFEFSRKIPLLTSLSKGRWNDFVLRVRWSGRSDGVVEVWHRVAGSGGFVKKISLPGITTLQYAPARGQSTTNPASIYILWGLYRGSYCSQPTQLGCTSPLGIQPTNVLYQDGFVRGSSFSEVAAAAFGEGAGTPYTPDSPAPTPAPSPTPTPPLSPAPPPVQTHTNLAPNPGFEEAPTSTWYTVPDGGTYTWAAEPRSGTRSLKIASSVSGMTRWMSKTPIAVSAGAVYSASAYLKAAGSGALALVFWDGQGKPLGTITSQPVAAGDWSQASVQTAAPAAAATVRVEFRLSGAGSLAADDVSLMSLSPSAPAPRPTPTPSPSPSPPSTPGSPAPFSPDDVDVPDPTPFDGDAPAPETASPSAPSSARGVAPNVVGQPLRPGSRLIVVRDEGCVDCVAKPMGRSVDLSVPGSTSDANSAYVVKPVVAAPGGFAKSRLVLRLANGQRLDGKLTVTQVRDTKGRVVYELYVARDRTLWFWSPAGGLAAEAISASTGVRVPNSGPRGLRVVVTAKRNYSVEVRVNGARKFVKTGLSGAPPAAQVQHRVGIIRYSARSAGPVRIFCGWLD